MKKYEHLKRKALEFREQGMSLGEICEHLNLGKTTVYHWIKGTKLAGRTEGQTKGQRLGNLASQKKWRLKREAAYDAGLACLPELLQNADFRDFVVMYMAEGYKRCRNHVMLANSDPCIIQLAYKWIKKLATNKLDFTLQYHVDQDVNELIDFWSSLLGIDRQVIRIIRKSNSGQLTGRKWRSKYGVFTVGSADTYLRSKLEAWIVTIKSQW